MIIEVLKNFLLSGLNYIRMQTPFNKPMKPDLI